MRTSWTRPVQVNLQVDHDHVSTPLPLPSHSMATTATSKPGLDGLLIFEQPFARVRLVPLFSSRL